MSSMDVETLNDFSNDLLFLDRVFLRIGNAETDEHLQDCLTKCLPPIILKLSPPNEQVRSKVMDLLDHVNKRVKCRSKVQLPVRTLLQQYRDPNATDFVAYFAIIYITMGFPRLPREQQLELVPEILNAITSRPQSHQDGILVLLMPLLGDVDAKNLNLKENAILSQLVVRFATDILLLPYSALPGNSSEGTEIQVPPGMSLRSYKRITAKNVFTAAQLEEMKTSIVKFIKKGVIKDTEILLPLIVATADSRFNVAKLATSLLTRVASSVDWTSSATVAPLYALYLGLGGGQTAAAEDKTAPARTRLKLKLLPYLNRSSGAAILFPHCMQVILTSLFDENANSHLKNLAISYTLIVINGGEIEQLKQVAGVLLDGVLRVIRSAEFHEHHPRTFTCVGRLAVRIPNSFNSQFGLLEEFVGKMPEASPELKAAIRDALLDMSHAFKIPHAKKTKEEAMEVVPSASTSQQAEEKMEVEGEDNSVEMNGDMDDVTQQQTLIGLLDRYLHCDDPMIRYVATRYAASVFPPDSVPSRYLLLLASGDSKDKVAMEALKSLYGVTRPDEIEGVVNNITNRDQGSEAANVAIPPFPELVEYLWEQMERRKRGSNAKHRFVVQNHVLSFHPITYTEMVRYMRASLVRMAGLKDCSAHPCSQTPLLAKYVRESLVDRPALKHYISMLTSLMVAVPDVMPLTGLLDIISCMPDKMSAEYAAHLPFFRNLFTNSTKEEVRDVSASLYAKILVWSTDSPQKILDKVSYLVGRAGSETSLETRCGLAGAAARLAEGCLRRYGIEVGDKKNVTTVVVELVKMLSSGNNLLVGTACSNLALLARCTGLPIPDSSPADGFSDVTKQALLGQLFEVIANAKFSSKTKEKALSTLGLLCVGERFPFAKKIVQGFLDMAKDMCIRAVEDGKSGNEVLAAILPVLLDAGITHLVKEVRNISVKPSETPVDPAFFEECARIVLGECTKKDPTHTRHALLALADIPLPPTMFTGSHDIVNGVLAEDNINSDTSSDDELQQRDPEPGSSTSTTQPLWTSAQATEPLNNEPFDDFTSGVSGACNLTADSSELDYFEHFLDGQLVAQIVNFTNSYHKFFISTRKIAMHSRLNRWKDTTVSELYVFFAITMLMTRARHLQVEEYWSTDPLLSSPMFGQLMPRNRYCLILSMLHFCEPDSTQPIHRKLYKISLMVEHARKKFKNSLIPYSNLCIDESIVPYKGSIKQYLPKKSNRLCVKLFVMCDVKTNIILDFIVYCGTDTDIHTTDVGLGVSGRVVTTLTSDYYGSHRKLYTDNRYTSPRLYNHLLANGIYACGTVNARREGMPTFPNLKKDEVHAEFANGLMALKWRDKKDVYMLSTFHDASVGPTNKIDRNSGLPILKPKCVNDYNKNMGSVDTTAMMISSLQCIRKTCKWYKKVALHILDMHLLNSFYYFRLLTENREVKLSDFQLAVIRQMISKHHESKNPLNTPSTSSRQINHPLRILSENITKHMPVLIPGNKRRKCKVCSLRKNRKDTRYICPTCEVPLCVVPCFAVYHKSAQFSSA